MTGLPFVFAVWVSNKKMQHDFNVIFNNANKIGIESINKIPTRLNFTDYNLDVYFKKNISYSFNSQKHQGMNLFLELIG
jgi:chorismate dehydratase